MTRHAKLSPLSTPGMHSALTYKQADVLTYLYADVRAATVAEIAECLSEMQEWDISEGRRVHYVPPSYQSIYTTLKTLERRGLVMQVDLRDEHNNWIGNGWDLTRNGEDVCKQQRL